MPPITVLMPVFNAGKFLSDAIDSILCQTFEDFEFLIVDDGSVDNSVAIIESYSDKRIRLIKNEQNLGISATLNKGIQLATASCIARMDADDISYPDRLEKQWKYLQANPDCAMVSSLVRVISENGSIIRQDKFKSEHFYYNLTFICWIYHSTVMYRKEVLESINGYTTKYSEDFELFWQLSRKYRIYNLPEILLDYRETSQSLHQVLRKSEYEIAQQAQVLRNIHYYTGSHYDIPENYIECFRHNFQPILKEQKLNSLITCVKHLDVITQAIINKSNVNYDAAAIRKAAAYKRAYIIQRLAEQLSLHEKLLLKVSLESFRTLTKPIKIYLKRRMATYLNYKHSGITKIE